jgi:SAM-dependent methyltransferase
MTMRAAGEPLQHGQEPPSAWVQRWTHLVRPNGSVLDVACGHGRHMAWFAQHGHTVTGVDRSEQAVDAASAFGKCVLADIENGPWPLQMKGQPQTFDAVVVTNYLWRPLLPTLLQSVSAGGFLIYETFAAGHETVGKPSRADFLLQPGELLRAFASLRVVAYENGFIDTPARFVQRLVAVSPSPEHTSASTPARWFLM